MDAKFDLLISSLQNADAKKGEKALVTKYGPELKRNPDDKEGGEGGGEAGKNKETAVVKYTTVQQRYLAAGSSSKAGDSSSGQGQRQHLLMDSTLMLDTETISKRFTLEIEIGGRREILFYRDPRIQEADEELARKLNQELNPYYDFEESLEEQRKVEHKKTPKAPRGRGKGRGRGRTQSVPARPIEKGIMIREPAEQSRSSLSSQPTKSTDRKGKGILIEEPKKKSKKSYSFVPESVQSTPVVEEEKKSDKVVESTLNANPESSTLQSTGNPEASNPDNVQNSANHDGDSTANPDGINPDGDSTANHDGTNPEEHKDADPDLINPDDQGITDTHDSEGDEVQNQQNNSAAERENTEEVNPDQADGEEKASWIKVKLYVYKNKIINWERASTAVTEAFRK